LVMFMAESAALALPTVIIVAKRGTLSAE